jgi:hypothetical protein
MRALDRERRLFEDELMRVQAILEQATASIVLVMNERIACTSRNST